MQRLYSWLRTRPKAVDRLLAGACALLSFPFALSYVSSIETLAAFLTGVSWIPLLWRSRWPVAVMYVVAALGFWQLLVVDIPSPGSLVAAMVMAFTAAATAPRRHARAALVLTVVGGAFAGLTLGRDGLSLGVDHYRDLVVLLLVMIACITPLVVSWLWGDIVRARQAYLQEALDRAERLEREQDALARVAVVEERNRIAREMHDVVAHSLSVMVLQADGAAYVLDSDPDRAAKALAAISRTGRDSLAEMRRLLGVLRSADDATEHPAERAPQPGVDRIDELVEQVRDAGLQVRYEVTGDPAAVPATVGLSTYRIVQEALTNTLKHGGPDSRAAVRLDYQPDRLLLDVSDDGRGAAAASDGRGHGVMGMRERVGALGGRLVAGPRPGGGYAVTAELPFGMLEAGAQGR